MTLEIRFIPSCDRSALELGRSLIPENCFQHQKAMIGMALGKAKGTPAEGASYEHNLHRRF
ncbi:MAG: hypothetical protein KME12_18305 [Trichocoleus desertorum ATA4-8-CV12]|nr:hypothetical protein [Trichocoleus desertorum ATA4-8-CV12]